MLQFVAVRSARMVRCVRVKREKTRSGWGNEKQAWREDMILRS